MKRFSIFGTPVPFGIPVSFYPKLVKTKTNLTNAKPVNFTRRL
jgi:hypothetical protein